MIKVKNHHHSAPRKQLLIRRQLLDQWHEKLAMFLSIPQEQIGIIGGGKRKPTSIVDIGSFRQSIGDVHDFMPSLEYPKNSHVFE